MSKSGVKPALTEEEWLREEPDPGKGKPLGDWRDPRDGLVRIERRQDKHSLLVVKEGGLVAYHESGWRYPLRRRHAIAALALHDQPFGFTWEDVSALRFHVGGMRDQGVTGTDLDVPANILESIADRIEALLPPREE